jgi:hypothetical protein
MRKLALAFGFLGVLSASMRAQEAPKVAFSAGAGFTTPVTAAGNNLDTGWNVRAGIGMYFTRQVGVNLDFGYDSMGVTTSVLNNLGYGGGNDDVFSVTLNPIVHLNSHGPVGVYVTGGGGFYHDYQNFTQPAVVTGFGFNPFFGVYPYAGTANVVVSSYSVNKPGIDAGMGIEFGHKWGGKFFAEARWNRIFIGDYKMDFVPVTFGFRR